MSRCDEGLKMGIFGQVVLFRLDSGGFSTTVASQRRNQ